MKATVTSKGQVTIPSKIRDRLGIVEGTILEFDEEVSFLKAIPKFDETDMRQLLGSREDLPASTDYLDETRGKVSLPAFVNEDQLNETGD